MWKLRVGSSAAAAEIARSRPLKNPGDKGLVVISEGEVSVGSNNFRFEHTFDPNATNEEVLEPQCWWGADPSTLRMYR